MSPTDAAYQIVYENKKKKKHTNRVVSMRAHIFINVSNDTYTDTRWYAQYRQQGFTLLALAFCALWVRETDRILAAKKCELFVYVVFYFFDFLCETLALAIAGG